MLLLFRRSLAIELQSLDVMNDDQYNKYLNKVLNNPYMCFDGK